jgi:hypothetical protein
MTKVRPCCLILTLLFGDCSAQAQQSKAAAKEQAERIGYLLVRREEALRHKSDDECTRLLKKVSEKKVQLDATEQKAFTTSLLTALNIPVSSQLLVFSGTASQGRKVNASNPRAIYFNDETYVGVVPGGFVEMIGVDPQNGAVFYSFEKLQKGKATVANREESCVRCHATAEGMPGMVMRSIIPTATGSTFQNFENSKGGHQNPFVDRFGGWMVTSAQPLGQTREGQLGEQAPDGAKYTHITPGQMYAPDLHLTQNSDIVAHLVHEHQLGFINRMANVTAYTLDGRRRTRTRGKVDTAFLDDLVRPLIRYILFADEAALPEGGIVGDPAFMQDFAQNRKPSKSGISLKDFDLKTHIFKYRCSYMIYTRQWREMPPLAKERVYALLKEALSGKDSQYEYMPLEERRAIVEIIRDTVPDLPKDWR